MDTAGFFRPAVSLHPGPRKGEVAMKTKRWPDILICLAVSIVLLIFCSQLPGINPMARTYPIVVIAGSFVMVAIILVQTFTKKQPAQSTESGDPPLSKKTTIRIIIYCVAILVYILLMDKLGYIISTIVFAVYSLIFMHNKNKIVIVVLPVIFALLMYFIFLKFLYVTLPTGSWIENLL